MTVQITGMSSKVLIFVKNIDTSCVVFNGVNSHFLLIHNKNNLKTKWSIYLDDNEPELRSKFHFVPWIEFNNLVDCATGGGLKVFFFSFPHSYLHHLFDIMKNPLIASCHAGILVASMHCLVGWCGNWKFIKWKLD